MVNIKKECEEFTSRVYLINGEVHLCRFSYCYVTDDGCNGYMVCKTTSFFKIVFGCKNL